MTIDELISRLPPDGWVLGRLGLIMRADSRECPICYVVRELTGNSIPNTDHRMAAKLIGMGEESWEVACSASGAVNDALRSRLLAACGLKERSDQ